MTPSPLSEIVEAQKSGRTLGITSICSANPAVLTAALRYWSRTGGCLLIESTCNQVNQFGGYTGWSPQEFMTYVNQMVANTAFPPDRLILGGDHLGPSPWQHQPAAAAMQNAHDLVRDYVLAGYHKIHLDASMKLAGDDPERPLEKEIAARRSAELAQTAEEAFHNAAASGSRAASGPAPHYVIGTEVPLPGGAVEQEEGLVVTPTADVAETIDLTQRFFLELGLDEAWERVVAVVVQPGVEYGDNTIFDYDPNQAVALSRFIEDQDNLIYEAHSTDYQTRRRLKNLVRDHFAILKVGPALTFAYREAVFALAMIEEALAPLTNDLTPSLVRQKLEAVMLANPVYWRSHYGGDEPTQQLARAFSLSDRSRYYWPVPAVQGALATLTANLTAYPPPLSLLSQYLPVQFRRIREGRLENRPEAIIQDKIMEVLAGYAAACR